MPITQDVYSLSPGAIVELYELDTTGIDSPGTVYRFHDGTNSKIVSGSPELGDILWKAYTYSAFPVEVSGFSASTQGTLPKPILKIANVDGLIGSLNRLLNDMVGAKVTRIRTMAKYLDKENFTGDTNPLEDTTQSFPDDVFYVNRKVSENRVFVEYELASIFDVESIQLPRRQMVHNVCGWVYRSIQNGSSFGCPYSGGDVADARNRVVTDPNYNGSDVCGKRISSCKLRFPPVNGSESVLPFGGFPGTDLK